MKNYPMIRKDLLIALCCALAALTACKKGNTQIEEPGEELKLTTVEQQRVTADNSFALKLLKTVYSANTATGANLMISPLSVNFALGMTNNGSNGQTLTAINNAINFNSFTQDQVNTYYHDLLTGLPKVDPTASLKIANSIWYKQNFSVLPQFLQTNASLYQAKVQAVDFTSSATKDMMNQWVSDQTNGKITNIINTIPDGAIMFLINTIYFKSTWNTRFDPAYTNQQNFYLPNGGTVQANFMSSVIDYNACFDDRAYVFELPYHDKKYSMVVVMPVGTATIPSTLSTLDSVKWQTWMSNLQPKNNNLIFPKFKFGFGVKLNDALTTLGMGIAFTNLADFTRISATGGLCISEVQHKTYIETDEDGTEAAAATSVGIIATGANPAYSTVNHPFIFAIREMKTGIILFTGIVNNPLLTGN